MRFKARVVSLVEVERRTGIDFGFSLVISGYVKFNGFPRRRLFLAQFVLNRLD